MGAEASGLVAPPPPAAGTAMDLGPQLSHEAPVTVSLAGLTLHVADVDRSLAFYQQLPGATLLFHLPGRFALLRFGTSRLGLLADRKRPFHVEFDVPDLDTAAVELQRLGIAIDGPTTRSWGKRDVLVEDPDGNLLEFSAERPAGKP